LKPVLLPDVIACGLLTLGRLQKNQVDFPKQTSAAEDGDDFAAATARLKVVPFSKSARIRVFPQPVKVVPFPETQLAKGVFSATC
jgi:hypothetical protein